MEGKSLIYCFDCDGVICHTKGTDYEKAEPDPEVINKINWLHEKGHTIKIFTGRGSVSKIDWRLLTESQLGRWKVKYDELIMGKPNYDVFVDDLAWNIKDFREDKV